MRLPVTSTGVRAKVTCRSGGTCVGYAVGGSVGGSSIGCHFRGDTFQRPHGLLHRVQPLPRQRIPACVALLLFAEAGGTAVTLDDLPARQRHYPNSKAVVLQDIALVSVEYGQIVDGRVQRDRYTLTR